MKEIVQVNIGSEVFLLDDDACRTLKSYLDNIRSRLPEGDSETLFDIETRIAEILRDRVGGSSRVVTIEMVRDAMACMGSPSDFGERRSNTDRRPETPRRLYRSSHDRMLGGVCGGLARYLETDVTLVRVVAILLVLLAGVTLWAYPLCWLVIPEEPRRMRSER